MANRAEDENALRDLNARYCRGCDRRDFALIRSLFHDDATDDHGPMFRGDVEAFVAWLGGSLEPWELTSHSISNSLFVVQGDRAEGETYIAAYHRTQPPQRREYNYFGRYIDRYERRNGQWKILHRACVLDHGHVREVDEAVFREFSTYTVAGTADSHDPSWQFPLLAGLA